MTNVLGSASPTLARMHQAAGQFLGWWQRQLASLLPARLRLWWRQADRIVLLRFEGPVASLDRPSTDRLERILDLRIEPSETPAQRDAIRRSLAKAAGGNSLIMLCLPEQKVLRHTITLPAAVEENLRQTLTFELDRHTPFKPSQAFFDFRVGERNSGQIQVDIAVAPTAVIDTLAARANVFGLSLAGAVLAEDVLRHGAHCLNLLPVTARRAGGQGASRRRWRVAAAALALALLGSLLALPIWQKRSAAIELIAPLEEAKRAARETDSLRDKLGRLGDEYNFLPNEKWNGYSVLRVLDEISRRLPDDTFLIQFDYDGKTIQIQGESGSAATLVETLEGSPMFKDVSYKSQLIKIQGTPFDRFHIGATLENPERSRLGEAKAGSGKPDAAPGPSAAEARQ